MYDSSIANSYWVADTNRASEVLGDDDTSTTLTNNAGVTLAELQCPTSSDDTECVYGTTLYEGWGEESYVNDAGELVYLWDFGTSSELPVLNLEALAGQNGQNSAGKSPSGSSGGGGGSLLWLLALAPLAGVSRRKSKSVKQKKAA